MRELALVSLKRFSLLPGNVDFAGGSNNSITPEKKVKKAVRDQAKSLKAEQTSIFEGDLINEDFELNINKFIFKEDNNAYEIYKSIVYKMVNEINKFEGVSLYNKSFIELSNASLPIELINYYKVVP